MFHDIVHGITDNLSDAGPNEGHQCLSFRVHVQPKVQFQNSSQLTAYYRWMSSMLSEAYYALEKEYMTPDQDFKMPETPNATCTYCKTSE